MLGIYSVSTQFVTVPIITDPADADPTSDPVFIAFLGGYSNQSQAQEAVPNANTVWYDAAWTAAAQEATTGPWGATVLVGPESGIVTLSTGTYLVLAKITASPEAPVLFSGTMAVS